jgi:beta-mannosidase
MNKILLNGTWNMQGNGYNVDGKIPGSIYSFLLDAKLIDDPFYRDNEDFALKLCEHDYIFSRKFDVKKTNNKFLLCLEGIDTIADIFVNGFFVAHVQNMHLKYEFDVTNLLISGENEVAVKIYSVLPYLKSVPVKTGVRDCISGFPRLRKAHCMMGWDWGPRLTDGGLWKDVYLLELDSARITNFVVDQKIENGVAYLTPKADTDTPCNVEITLTHPDGKTEKLVNNAVNKIDNPELWWPNGYGKQPLYTICANIVKDGKVVDSFSKKLGLRTMELVRDKDEYGESFYHRVNGVNIFAKGADYIPEDNVLSRTNKERSRALLQDCLDANFNTIRIWGGGYYPEDWFFDLCDEMGIMLFFDLMFACCIVPKEDELFETIKVEVRQNLTRIRDHACIAVISGNNEVEECLPHGPTYGSWVNDEELKAGYIELYEEIIPKIVNEVSPALAYMPSSPTSFSWDISPRDENYGDCHYWQVWHGNKPFTEYRKYFFRYLSEFGFQSFPCEKTVKSFTLPEDRNIFSRIMEKHQRNGTANGKILMYLADTFLYPSNFGDLLYASQLLQAESIKYGVEHFRRNRGRCMGTLYWQLNDIWPVASWASIDYYGRWKALHYYAKRFYNPILISCNETSEKATRTNVNVEPYECDWSTKAQLCITNDNLSPITGIVKWALRRSDASIITSGDASVTVPELSALWLDEMDFNKTDFENNYMSYEFIVDGKVASCGTVLFTAPKHFKFKKPTFDIKVDGNKVTVKCDCYAKSVELYSDDSDFTLSDNFFDINGGETTVTLVRGELKNLKVRSMYSIR